MSNSKELAMHAVRLGILRPRLSVVRSLAILGMALALALLPIGLGAHRCRQLSDRWWAKAMQR